jgi:hypothetical protein
MRKHEHVRATVRSLAVCAARDDKIADARWDWATPGGAHATSRALGGDSPRTTVAPQKRRSSIALFLPWALHLLFCNG